MDLAIVIPARGGSKRLPGKNMRLFEGEPLICRAIRTALQVTHNVYVPTDCPEIKRAAGDFGVRRPDYLCLDDSLVEETWRWFCMKVAEPKILVHLECTSPFITPGDIRHAIDALDRNTDMVARVCEGWLTGALLAFRPNYIFNRRLWMGNVRVIEAEVQRHCDINTEEDLEFARA